MINSQIGKFVFVSRELLSSSPATLIREWGISCSVKGGQFDVKVASIVSVVWVMYYSLQQNINIFWCNQIIKKIICFFLHLTSLCIKWLDVCNSPGVWRISVWSFFKKKKTAKYQLISEDSVLSLNICWFLNNYSCVGCVSISKQM